MGGLTFAASLRKFDPNSVDINLYEAASEITGMSFIPSLSSILQRLGRVFHSGAGPGLP